jgi:hypothetical protein
MTKSTKYYLIALVIFSIILLLLNQHIFIEYYGMEFIVGFDDVAQYVIGIWIFLFSGYILSNMLTFKKPKDTSKDL